MIQKNKGDKAWLWKWGAGRYIGEYTGVTTMTNGTDRKLMKFNIIGMSDDGINIVDYNPKQTVEAWNWEVKWL